MKNIEKALNHPKSSIKQTSPIPPKSVNPSISSSASTMRESDTESVASNGNNGYDSALDDLLNEKTSSDLLAKLKTHPASVNPKIDDEKLVLSSTEKNANESKLPSKMTRKQTYDGGRASLITRLTGSGKIELLPDGSLFNNMSETGIPLQEFFSIISQWNKKISEAEIAFFKPIIHLLNMTEVKNKAIKVMLEEQRFKNPKKRWFKVSPYQIFKKKN